MRLPEEILSVPQRFFSCGDPFGLCFLGKARRTPQLLDDIVKNRVGFVVTPERPQQQSQAYPRLGTGLINGNSPVF